MNRKRLMIAFSMLIVIAMFTCMDNVTSYAKQSNQKVTLKPMVGPIASGYGWRNLGYGKEFHYGVDISGPVGSKVVAIASGVVKKKYSSCPKVGSLTSTCGNGGWGNYLLVKHTVNGKTYEAVYANLSSVKVKVGAKVKKGQTIALSGQSGRVTGPQLYFEVHKNKRSNYKNVVNPNTVIPLSD